jgi:hypothetical protein
MFLKHSITTMATCQEWRPQMTTIARALFGKVTATGTESEVLKTIITFCAAGLFVSLLLACYGIDLSAGFF